MNQTCLFRLMNDALREEHNKYLEMLELSNEQVSLLRETDPDTAKIARLMNQKVQIVEELQVLEQNHQQVKDQWHLEYQQYSLDDRNVIKEIRDASIQTIERLNASEEIIAKSIKRHQVDINQQLGNFQQGRNANQAYFSYESMPPRYIDKKK